ncbi:dynamin family protein [Litchfieldia alkalitelluris]|uniref:dynamin family protein n=1 Tax=Litchfieldia alkalitelluris TaxID=304268 RepID=UPI001F266631|nr:dynamin family protein [Litchfieldia alkalitelluris]
MVKAMESTKEVKSEIIHNLVYLYQEISHDKDHAFKLKQLIRKLDSSEFMIGFCGHFSAGKSSMINELVGENLLPSSPIPTSANLVMVKQGPDYARVHYKQGDIVEYPAPYDYEVIKEYAKDGDEVDSIEISHQMTKLKKGVTIMDTPGIDSTDDAHRVSTESALHLADIIFYVMDYNHVQSELNFQFAKEMKDRGKPLYLIINQIDKHQESELSFDQFKESVVQAFQDYRVFPDGYFYTSLRNQNDKHNQLNKLKLLITETIKNKDQLLIDSVMNSSQQVIREHLLHRDQLHKEEKSQWEQTLNEMEEVGSEESVIDLIFQTENNINEQTQKVEGISSEFYDGINNILSNAYLMPFSTRELAKNYIESRQEGFKVGFLFSKAKTDQERELRLEQFYSDLMERVSSQLIWHIKDYVNKFFTEHQLTSLLHKVADFDIVISKDILINSFKTGARLTGDYVLTYTDDVVREIKKQYRNIANSLTEELKVLLRKNTERELASMRKLLSKYKTYQQALNKLSDYQKEQEEYKEYLQKVLHDGGENDHQINISAVVEEDRKIQISTTKDKALKKRSEKLNYLRKVSSEKNTQKELNSEERANLAVNHLVAAKNEIKEIRGLSTLCSDMDTKAERLKNNQFTVALFGAFSAGKSSFANALIGQQVLPVSPNPTTATINKIKPPTSTHPHGTVIVKLKSSEQLLDDLVHSLRVFNKEATSLTEALYQLNIITKVTNEPEAKEKPHLRFLKAVSSGYDNLIASLGEQVKVGVEDFKEYVAVEEKACFVEWIELYYDSPVTRKGITLVDTPGADSINARHTGVAFNYIKNADAVLFVTYYNHAFSKADREFLIQLGRVKDTFSMDKMFFIINAADLAASDEELEDVETYVEQQLTEYGIRSPRLYPLSSKLALREKLNHNKHSELGVTSSPMDRFEEDFKGFIDSELIDMTINSAYEDIAKARKTVEYYLGEARTDKDEKKKRLEIIIQQEKQILENIKDLDFAMERYGLGQEITELTFYIKQRVFLRYPDFFKESFNPAVLKDDGRNLKKTLQSCFNELTETIGFDLSQEMRATSLRVEKYINTLINNALIDVNRMINEIEQHLILTKAVSYDFPEIKFENGLENLNTAPYQKALSLFKNPKSFFEKNDKKLMSDKIYELLQEPVAHYLEENKLKLEEFYHKQFTNYTELTKIRMNQEVTDYYSGMKEVLSDHLDIESLEKIKESLLKMENRSET